MSNPEQPFNPEVQERGSEKNIQEMLEGLKKVQRELEERVRDIELLMAQAKKQGLTIDLSGGENRAFKDLQESGKLRPHLASVIVELYELEGELIDKGIEIPEGISPSWTEHKG